MSLRLFALFGLILGTLFAGQARAAGPCHTNADIWSAQGLANAEAAYAMPWTPFGSSEWGWRPYLPLIQHELHTRCGAGTPIFASQLAGFQQTHGLAPTGLLDAATFQVFRGVWQERRPFVMARVGGLCPESPPINQLGYLVAEEEHADRLTRLLRRDVLDAYRRLVAAARAEVPEVAANPELLQIFSGFRDPEADAARCAQQGNCDGLRRAVCSPHRTGTAVDLYVGQAPGLGVDSTSPASREYMARTETYRWLVENAGRFGFTPYVFEPWHWEYVRPWDPSFAP
nr:D-alanyl-D-alanine carboxypeptidase family protein [uncultured Brevundimonas sp.]